jgi:glycosyltransferase involved in cell wall biosynthesis
VLTVSLLTLGDPETMTGGYLYHRRVADRAAANDARLEFLSVPDQPFPLPVLAGPRLLRRALAEDRPDVLLIDSIAAAFVGPPPEDLPLVAILHQPPGGIDHAGFRQRLQAILDRRTYRHLHRMLVASEDLANTLREAGIPMDLMRVVPPGRDPAADPVKPAIDLRQGRKTAILSVGNWVERKGLLELLEAVARLPENAATLHLLGDPDVEPDYASKVRQRLEEPDLRTRVVSHGVVAPAEVVGFYQACDIFALASLREPYGTVYGEAMACGLPVVGWNAGNLPHLARSGVEGFAVEPGNVAELASALERLAEDQPLRARMAAAAAAKATEFPTWDETARMLYSELRKAVKETGK